MKPIRSPISFAIALAVCAGCAAPRPPVPHRELAERILQPPPPTVDHPLEELPPADQSPQRDPSTNQSNARRSDSRFIPANYTTTAPADDETNANAISNQPAHPYPFGRRLNISQSRALAEPLDAASAPNSLNDAATRGGPPRRTANESAAADSATCGDQLMLATAIDLAYRNNPSIAASRPG